MAEGKIGFFSLGQVTSLGQGKVEFKLALLHLNIGLVLHPAHVGGRVNTHNTKFYA